MSLVTKDPVEIRATILAFFVIEGLVQFQLFLNQIFCARISLEYLTAYSMLGFLGVFYYVLGTSLGEACMVVTRPELRVHQLRQQFGGALGFLIVVSLIASLIFYILQDSVMAGLEVSGLPLIKSHFLIWLMISNLTGLTTFLAYFYANTDRSKMFRFNLISFSVNVVLGITSLLLFDKEVDRFLAISCSLLISMFLTAVMGLYWARKYLRVSVRNMGLFFGRSRRIFFGDFFTYSAVFLSPLIFSKFLIMNVGGESVAAFNLGFKLMEIFALLLWGVQFSGMSWLMEVWKFRGEPEWFYCLRSTLKTSSTMVGLPILVTALVLPFCMPWMFELHTVDAAIISVGTLLSLLPQVLAVGVLCRINAFELQYVRAIANFAAFYVVMLPALYFFGSHPSAFLAVCLGRILPGSLEMILLKWYARFTRMDDAPTVNRPSKA